MKTFDWELAKTSHSIGWWHWLKNNFDKPVTLEQYTEEYTKGRENDLRPNKARRYYHKQVAHNYHHLKENFGFFPTE